MSAILNTASIVQRAQGLGMPVYSTEEVPMREKLVAVRDTLVVLSMQLSFRIAMLLRNWNY